MDPLITAGNNAVAKVDNNPAQTQADNASYAAANPGVFGGSQNSTTPTVMTPGQAFNNTKTDVPTVPAQDTSAGIIGQANQTIDSITRSLTPADTAADTQNQGLLNDIATLTGQDANKGDEQAQLNSKYGVNADQQALLDAQNELASKTAHYTQLQANLGGNGSVETSAVLAAQNSGLLKANAADIGITNAKITAAQGNLQLAQQQVANAINLKYGDIEAQVKTKQAQLNALTPLLDKQQKTQALAQQVLLKQQEQQIQDKKDKETQINNIMLQAAQAGANKDILAKIQTSGDVVSAISAASTALGAKVANELKQQAFDNALKLRSAANDATRVAIEQQNANIALQKLRLEQNAASQSASNAIVTTISGKKYVDGTNLDAAGKTAALNAGQIVLSGDASKSMTAINNVQGSLGSLLASFQQNGVDLSSTQTTPSGSVINKGATGGFMRSWAAGNATPAVDAFGTNLKDVIKDLQKLPGTGNLVNTLQANVLSGKDDASTMKSKITNIATALNDSENGLLVDNSHPAQITLNGKILNLQADGTYQ